MTSFDVSSTDFESVTTSGCNTSVAVVDGVAGGETDVGSVVDEFAGFISGFFNIYRQEIAFKNEFAYDYVLLWLRDRIVRVPSVVPRA